MPDRPTYPIRLEKRDNELLVVWRLPHPKVPGAWVTTTKLLHKFKFNSEPDLLFDELVHKPKRRPLRKGDLLKSGLLTNRQTNFIRILNEQIKLIGPLRPLFVVFLTSNSVQIRLRTTATELEIRKVNNFLDALEGGIGKRKAELFYHIPEDED